MSFSESYLEYLYQFHMTRDFFECHEIMEEAWKASRHYPNKQVVEVVLVQLATSLYHWRRHNYAGARDQISRVKKALPKVIQSLDETYGIEAKIFVEDVSDLVYVIEEEMPYFDYNLPLKTDIHQQYCQRYGLSSQQWHIVSDMENEALIHHHLPKYRDAHEQGEKTYRFIGMENEMFQDVLTIRDTVFAKEQGYDPNLDPDEVDNYATQFIIYDNSQPVSVARLYQALDTGKYQVGRVATLSTFRKKGYAAKLMKAIIDHCKLQRASSYIELHAQVHAIRFYQNLGFKTVGDEYLEEGEPHQTMELEI